MMDGHHGSRGMDDELPADLADHDSWLSSLLGDTTDEAMDNTWFPNPWDVMTHTTSHFDFDMGSKMEDSNKPPKGPKGKPGKGGKKPKGPQKGPKKGKGGKAKQAINNGKKNIKQKGKGMKKGPGKGQKKQKGR